MVLPEAFHFMLDRFIYSQLLQCLRAEIPDRTPGLLKAFARQTARLVQVFLYIFSCVAKGLLCGLKLQNYTRKPLGKSIMYLPGHPVAFFCHRHLPGLLVQPGILDGDCKLVGQRLRSEYISLIKTIYFRAFNIQHSQHPATHFNRHSKF